MTRSLTAAFAAALLSTAGCLDTSGANSSTITFDFNAGAGENWSGGAADYPVGQENNVGAVTDRRFLPPSLAPTVSALYLSGTNVSGDLFLFQKKFFSGLLPNTTYRIQVRLEFASNLHSGCTTGAGPLTVIKAGLTTTEPLAAPDGQSVYRMSIDKGAGTAGGGFAQLGDIRNGLSNCPTPGTYELRITSLENQSQTITTDGQGGFWIFVGTQSSFVGFHEIFVTQLQLVLRLA